MSRVSQNFRTQQAAGYLTRKRRSGILPERCRTMAARLSYLDSSSANEKTKEAFFDLFDENADGSIDRSEFSSLYDRIAEHVRKEHIHEREAQQEIKESHIEVQVNKRRVKALACISLAVFSVLAFSTAANAIIVYHFVYGAKDSEVSADAVLKSMNTGQAIVTGTNHVNVTVSNATMRRRRRLSPSRAEIGVHFGSAPLIACEHAKCLRG